MSNLKSSVFIARLLDSEGFSDFVANQVERYWKRSICDRRYLRKYGKLDQDITEMCKKLTEGEKHILGKFIGLHKKMSFDTGLRIGLTAYAVKNDKPIDPFADRINLGSAAGADGEVSREGTPENTSSGQTSVAKKGDAERRA